jgi:acetyltransferase-like isoleucine patch superfamily enzyme
MALKSLNQLRSFRNALIRWRNRWIERRLGVVFGANASVSLSARFRPAGPGEIVIGDDTLIAFKTLFLTRDIVTGEIKPIRIGSRCFIGGGSIILPGVTVADECIVGGGAVVFDDVPPRSIVVGNPARVLRNDIEVGPMGRLKGADQKTREMYRL